MQVESIAGRDRLMRKVSIPGQPWGRAAFTGSAVAVSAEQSLVPGDFMAAGSMVLVAFTAAVASMLGGHPEASAVRATGFKRGWSGSARNQTRLARTRCGSPIAGRELEAPTSTAKACPALTLGSRMPGQRSALPSSA